MTYSKGTWRYDAESGEVLTSDRTGFWGPDHEPVSVCPVTPLDGVNNGPLLAAAHELLVALRLVMPALEFMRMQHPRSKHDDSFDVVENARAILARLEASE